MENIVGVPPIIRQNYHMTQQFYFWVYTQKNSMKVSKTYLYIYVHSSIICNGRKVDASQVFTNRLMDKQNVVYTHNEILFSIKKGNSDLCYNMDDTWGYANWNVNHCVMQCNAYSNPNYCCFCFILCKLRLLIVMQLAWSSRVGKQQSRC